MPFAELAGRVKEVVLAGLAHQELPFEVLVEKLAPRRELAYSPVFQALFAMQNAPGESFALPGVRCAP